MVNRTLHFIKRAQLFIGALPKKTRGITFMLKEFVWRTFENTGNVDAYIFYKEIEERNKVPAFNNIAEDEAATGSSF